MLHFRKCKVLSYRSHGRFLGTPQTTFHERDDEPSASKLDGHGNGSRPVQGRLTPVSFRGIQSALEETFSYSVHNHSFQDSENNVDVFRCSNVSLECIQTKVTVPFNVNIEHYKYPGSFPASRGFLQKKYTNNTACYFEPSRKYHTTSKTPIQDGSSVPARASQKFDDSPCPQGIQGDDCTLELWMQSCMRYNLPNCDEQLKNIKEGRKTLSQVLEEQDLMIRQIAESYQAVQAKNAYARLNLKQVDGDTPSPQGIQGDDCVRFQLWLENCQRFGLSECQEQLNGIKSGRKTLAQVFAEQDASIRMIVANHYQKRTFSTSSNQSNKVVKDHNSTHPEKLSQKDRLKRAVKEYGSTVIVFHVGISLISLGGFYFAVSSGVDMVALLTKIGIGESLLQSKLTTGASTFVVAYAVHKVFAPVRIGITLTSVPFIVHYLRRIGFLKPSKK